VLLWLDLFEKQRCNLLSSAGVRDRVLNASPAAVSVKPAVRFTMEIETPARSARRVGEHGKTDSTRR